MKMPPVSGTNIDLQSSLEDAILRCDEMYALCDLLDKQATVAAPSPKLDAHLRKFIEQPVPYLTAAVFRLYRYTGSSDLVLHEAAAAYLNIRCYDGDWHDETINSIGWANDLLANGSESPLLAAYRELLRDAEARGQQDLLAFCHSYTRPSGR